MTSTSAPAWRWPPAGAARSEESQKRTFLALVRDRTLAGAITGQDRNASHLPFASCNPGPLHMGACDRLYHSAADVLRRAAAVRGRP